MPEPYSSTSNNNSPYLNLNTLSQHARELASQGKFGEARALFYADEFEGPDWQRQLGLGEFLLSTGQTADAIEPFSLVLDYAHQTDEKSLRSVACHNLAIAYRQLGYLQLAAQFQQYSIAWGDLRSADHQTLESEIHHLSEHAACDLTGRANDAILQQDYQLAEQLLNISLSREILDGDADAQAADWGNLGILQGLQGNHLRAIVYLRKAYQLHQQTQNHSALGQDLVHLAEVFQLTGRLKRAARCLQRAINCFSQCNSPGNAEQEACARLHELQRLLAVQQHDPLLN